MGKDPAFLFYPNDYIGGTMGMSFEEKGAYMELLMMQFNRGHMSLQMIGQTVGKLWDTIQDKFLQDEKGFWYNKRLEDEQNKRKAFTESRRNNKLGKNQYSKPTKKAGHLASDMENVNVNEKEDAYTANKGVSFSKNGDNDFSKAAELYKHVKKVSSAKTEWDNLSPEEKDQAMDHIPQIRKIFEEENRIRYLWDFHTYLYEKMFTQDIKTFKNGNTNSKKSTSSKIRKLGQGLIDKERELTGTK